MNAFTIFVAIQVGGMIWGISCMILFISLIGILKNFIEGMEKEKIMPFSSLKYPKKPK
jgi:predicted PurR-regulated permease PerM